MTWSSRATSAASSCSLKSGPQSTSNRSPLLSIRTEERVRRFLGSAGLHSPQSFPIRGTPDDGPQPRNGDVEPKIESRLGELGAAGEAMKNACDAPLFHLMGENLGSILLRIAGVDDERQTRDARRFDVRAKPFALRRAVRLIVIIVEPAFADGDHASMRSRFDQSSRADIRVRIRLMWMNADTGPDVIISFGRTHHLAPFALTGRDVEEAGDAARPGAGQHFLLPLGQSGVIQVAMTVDQPHAAASSSPRSSRGKIGVGWPIGVPSLPLSISVISLSAEAGMTGHTASASMRTAMTNVPSTSAMRCGSVLRSAQGAAASI